MLPRACRTWMTACALAVISVTTTASAEPRTSIPTSTVGISKLLVRLDTWDSIGIAGVDEHVRLIERLRAKGFSGVGAENLVFGKDDTRRAQYLIGGTVRELACVQRGRTLGCRVGVEWQVLDVTRDQVVYSVMSRAPVLRLPDWQQERMPAMLLTAALDRLLDRDDFRLAITPSPTEKPSKPEFPAAIFSQCALGRKMSESADDLLQATVVIKTSGGFGSGFFITADGLLLTAAHVLEGGGLKVRTRGGGELDAVPVRVAPHADVALLRTTTPLSGQKCAALRPDEPAVGSEVYAAGAPSSLTLASSLSRGIVSGFPLIEGQRHVQTDAPVNAGNSGGPLADANGAVLGIVSSKIVGSKIEGLGFAVPMHETLEALALRAGSTTDPSLMTTVAPPLEPPRSNPVVGAADPVPTIDPEGDQWRARERAAAAERADLRARQAERDRLTPAYIGLMRWGGVLMAGLGGAAVVATYAEYDDSQTSQSSFESLRTQNTLGWGAVGIGIGSFVMSYILQPGLPPRRQGATR
jgi:S1-C subfamily serine protease